MAAFPPQLAEPHRHESPLPLCGLTAAVYTEAQTARFARRPLHQPADQLMSQDQPDTSPWIINTTDETFQTDVFDKSHETVVVVDFWADWCQPCRMLGPILEGLAKEYEGKFLLVKADTAETPEAAKQFQVQGIPAVFAVIDGQVIDYFAGALPEDQIRGWLEALFTASLLAEAQRLEDISPEAAEAKYRQLAEQAPNDVNSRIGLARVLLAQERLDDCQEVIDELEKRGFLEPEAEKIKAALELRGMQGEDIDQLRADADAAPDNFQLQLQLAEALAGGQQYEAALQTCLSLVEKDRKGVGDQARQVMIDIFRVLPDDSELTTEYRRKLSMALY